MKNSKLPPELEKIKDGLYVSAVDAGEMKPIEGHWLDVGFTEGHFATLEWLAGKAESEFDEKAQWNAGSAAYAELDKRFDGDVPEYRTADFVRGARWQHQQTSLQFQAKIEKIQNQMALVLKASHEFDDLEEKIVKLEAEIENTQGMYDGLYKENSSLQIDADREIDCLTSQLAKAVEALKFYAEPNNWLIEKCIKPNLGMRSEMINQQLSMCMKMNSSNLCLEEPSHAKPWQS